MRAGRARQKVASGLGVLALVVAVATAGAAQAAPTRRSTKVGIRLRTLSTRADMVTGGDVLVAVESRAGSLGRVKVTRNGADVTSAFRAKSNGLRLVGLVDGLREGHNRLTATSPRGNATLAVVDHPITGPVFSGPHLPLPVCTTQELGLGKATDDDCSAPTKVDWKYESTDGTLKDLVDPKARPADVATTTVNGRQVDFVVRQERGVINRSVYWIAVLDTKPGDAHDTSGVVWNNRLVYEFGGGCGTSYSQGEPLVSALSPRLLGAGYAVTTATFNTFQVMCNDVLSAETVMMVKEHFIEEFGVPVHTIGEGASGGAIQQHLIVQNYPGLLDAISAILPFPDAATIAAGVTDCGLLLHYYGTEPGKALTPEQQLAINGHGSTGTCTLWAQTFLSAVDPTDDCDAKIPADQIYSATNPKGLRCTMPDTNVNEFGRDSSGFARRPLDNTGVQYGLKALDDAKITVDQFLDLNEHIGGYDINGVITATRTQADTKTLRLTYAKGRVLEASPSVRSVPIIDTNPYTDLAGDIHDRFRAFSVRARLQGRDTSPAGNMMIWTRGTTVTDLLGVIGNILNGGNQSSEAVVVLDRWLDNLAGDTGAGSRQEKLVRDRPAEAVDNCLAADGSRVSGLDLYTKPGPCTDRFPVHGDPRTVAGAPIRDDVIKCRLTPIHTSEYKATFTDAQRQRLTKIFPDGVCDWTKPGVGQVPLVGTWLRY